MLLAWWRILPDGFAASRRPLQCGSMRAIENIRKGIRWLQGMTDLNYWDLCDDTEYDYDDSSWLARSNFREEIISWI